MNGNVTGVNISGSSTDASCSMVSTMENSITNILKAITNQTNGSSSDAFSGVNTGINVNEGFQNVVNNIAQINNQVCNASQIISANDNFQYITNSNVQGSVVGVNISNSDAMANCAMTNYMKVNLFNSAQDTTTQGNGSDAFAIIAAIIAVIVIIMIIMALVSFYKSYFGGTPEENKKKQQTALKTAALLAV